MKTSNKKNTGAALLLLACWHTALQAGEPAAKGLSGDAVYELLPHRWVEVEKVDGKLVIQTYCDASVQRLSLEKEEGKVRLYHILGQDADFYTVLSGTGEGSHVDIKTRLHFWEGEPLETIKVTFLDEEKNLATWTIRGEAQLFARGVEGGDDEGTVLNLPVLPPVDNCEDYH